MHKYCKLVLIAVIQPPPPREYDHELLRQEVSSESTVTVNKK